MPTPVPRIRLERKECAVADAEDGNRQAREACAEFEALFINMMLKELRSTINKSGLMDGGKAEELYPV